MKLLHSHSTFRRLILILAAFASLLSPIGATNTPTGYNCTSKGGGCKKGGNKEGKSESDGRSLSFQMAIGTVHLGEPTDFTTMSRLGILEKGTHNSLRSFDTFKSEYYGGDPLNLQRIQLEFEVREITSDLYDPEILEIHNSGIFEQINKDDCIHQVLSETAFTQIDKLADLDPEDQRVGFQIRVWKLVDGQPLQKDGEYYTTPADQPVGTVTFRKPTAAEATPDIEEGKELFIIREEVFGTSGVYSTTERITRDMVADNLVFKTYFGTEPIGSPMEIETVTYSKRGPKLWDYTIERVIERAPTLGDTPNTELGDELFVVVRDREVYRDFSLSEEGGDYGDRRMVEHVRDLGGDELTTSYTFFDDPENRFVHGRRQSVVKPDGSWVYYELTDEPGSVTPTQTVYRSYLDVPIETFQDGIKELSTYEENKFVKTTTIQGTKIAESITERKISENGEHVVTQSRWTGTAYATTETVFASYQGNSVRSGRKRWQRNEDGTITTWAYVDLGDGLEITQTTGAPASGRVGAGEATITTYNESNNVIREEIIDIESGLTIYLKDSTNAGGAIDAQGRPTRWIYHGNPADYSEMVYGCCGLESSRDRNGMVTNYFRDNLKRVWKMTQAYAGDTNLQTTTTFYGPLTETTNREGLVTTKSYNLSGLRTVTETPDADLDGTPEISIREMVYEPNGGTTTTMTYPDGTTRVSTTLIDGKTDTMTDQEGHTSTYQYGTHALSGGGLWTRALQPGGAQPGGAQWTQTFRDPLGRTIKMAYPDGAETTYRYFSANGSIGSRNQLRSMRDPDRVLMEYGYNREGERTTTTRHLPDGLTTVTFSDDDVLANQTIGSATFATAIRQYTKVNEVLVSESFRSLDRRVSASRSFEVESGRVTEVPVNSDWKTVSTSPTGALSVGYYIDGLMTAALTLEPGSSIPASAPTSFDPAIAGLVTGTLYTHDDLHRVVTMTDARTGLTTYQYADTTGGLATNVLTAITAPGNRTTSFTYDTMGRRLSVDAPDTLDGTGTPLENVTHTSYTPRSQVEATWGDQTYPRRYEYDAQRRMTQLHTWQIAPAGEPTGSGDAITEWIYDSLRGWLVEKNYHGENGNGPGNTADYTYTAAGRLATRTWERGVSTSYRYDQGLLTTVDYSDNTPDLGYTYDNFGRIDEVTRNGALHARYEYRADNLLLEKEHLNQDAPQPQSLTRYYDNLLRPLSMSAAPTASPAASFHTCAYRYDGLSRLDGVWHEPSLDPNGLPTGGTLFEYEYEPNSGSLIDRLVGPHHTVDNTWDDTRNVLLTKRNYNEADNLTFSQYDYDVNDLGQRTAVTQSGTAFSNTGTTVATHSLVWGYDSRGQVISEDHSANARDNAYRYDAIGNRTHDVHGSLALPATANYAANPLNQYTTTPAALGAAPTYDTDGNTLSGPVPGANPVANGTAVQATNWIWDAENRLRGITVGSQSHTYDYDYLGRRIAQDSTVYLYDGWNLLTVQLGSNVSPACTFTWGLDLSGSMQGAGGVGGLLITRHEGVNCSPLYDGNGNATQFLADDGYRARWEYDAFGRTTWQSSDIWTTLIYHRFSTKYQDVLSTGLYYYGYRYYDPQTGRWPSRDPIGERGGVNLFWMVGNNPLNRFDYLGLQCSGELELEFFNDIAKDLGWDIDSRGEASGAPKTGNRFLDHYHRGNGRDMDLSGNASDTFSEEVDKITDAVVKKLEDVVNCLASKCKCEPGEGHGTGVESEMTGGSKIKYDKTRGGTDLDFALGEGFVFFGLNGGVWLDCCSCKAGYSIDLSFEVRDKFEDPADVGVDWGSPYGMNASWTKTIEDQIGVNNCPCSKK